ncbi:MAG TPA: ImmA/IrrE family metallo-endopeptidase [Solirubrobacterales bacterium]
MEPGRDAMELLKRVWMTEGPGDLILPVDPVQIARKLGMEVLHGDELGPEISGVLRKPAGFADAVIYLSPLDAVDRRRFTCAHALGHYSRNAEAGNTGEWEFVEGRDFFSADLDPDESYATEFAAELLMPRTALRELLDTRGVAALAAVFGVTGDVMGFRLGRIGLGAR